MAFIYHRFGELNYPSTNVTLEQFERHLDILEELEFEVLPLSKIVASQKAGLEIPDRTVAITMDDAYLSVYTNAFPLLKQRGLPFTVFVNTDIVDQQAPGFMTWQHMREMQEHGAEFANHGRSHDHFVYRLRGESFAEWERRVSDAVTHAQKRLQQELGEGVNEKPRMFAYPYGEFNAPLAKLIINLGYIGVGQHSGAIGISSDLRALPRFPMAERYAEASQFRLKALTKALPIEDLQPWNPQITDGNPPRLIVEFTESLANAGNITCYSQGEPLQIEWLEQHKTFATQAADSLPNGRSRYNCTLPAGGGRYYWLSQPWLVTEAND
ncbi:MAG: polysaccharide deacetylase family protein [Gammaproteobacteria bacterium]|nr:polysaccharide deacetylase family protein [Gammaproteobacteria bacterium]